MNENDRLRKIIQQIHGLDQKRSALCLSGEGIRSATFGLGVLRSLARLRLLDKFHFLSTVSGGGYIGSWLTAWIHRHPDGLRGVENELTSGANINSGHDSGPALWLRNHSNYLIQQLRFFSIDSWTLVGTYLRNLLLTWMVLLPLLIVGLMIPRLMVAFARWNLSDMGLPASLMKVLFYVGLGLIVIALNYLHVYRPNLEPFRSEHLNEPIEDQKWKRFESQKWFLALFLTPTVLSVLLLTNTWAWFRNAGGTLNQLALGGLGSRETFIMGAVLIHLLSWLFSALMLRRFKHLSRWMFLEVEVIAGTGALGGFFVWSVLDGLPSEMPVSSFAELYAFYTIPGILAMFMLTVTLFIAAAGRYINEQELEWWGRISSWLFIVIVLWMMLTGVVVYGPGLLALTPAVITSLGAFSGVIVLLLGFSSRTAATTGQRDRRLVKMADYAVKLATPVFIVYLLTLLALGTSWLLTVMAHQHGVSAVDLRSIGLQMLSDPWGHANVIHNAPLWLLVETSFTLAILCLGMAFLININQFSLLAIYRNRLIRVYLSASRVQDRRRLIDPITKLDPADDELMCNLRVNRKSALGPAPFQVLNIAVTQVTGANLAWQERIAHSFTVSPLHCGSRSLGYRSSEDYGESAIEKRPITLGTALTISGTPYHRTTGNHLSHLVNILLSAFNLRLGWWLGNPGPAGNWTYRRGYPELSVRPLVSEAFGLLDVQHPYVYLSDGGHFDNLGLYEIVLRRCHSILAVDASCDPDFTFEDLSNSIAKIRNDFGIDIEIDLVKLRRQPGTGISQWHHAIGKIRYDKVDDGGTIGTLVYLKPSLTGDEPGNISEFAGHHPDFPHEHQLTSGSQFDYYSRLGEHVTWEVLRPARHKSPHGFAALCDELWSQWVYQPHGKAKDFQSKYLVSSALWHDVMAHDQLGHDRPLVPWSSTDRVSAWVIMLLHLQSPNSCEGR